MIEMTGHSTYIICHFQNRLHSSPMRGYPARIAKANAAILQLNGRCKSSVPKASTIRTGDSVLFAAKTKRCR